MQYVPEAAFHPFTRLPLELRIQIWESVVVESRVLKVRKSRPGQGPYYWSPSPVPAVSRVCQEARKYCSYKRAFIIDGSVPPAESTITARPRAQSFPTVHKPSLSHDADTSKPETAREARYIWARFASDIVQMLGSVMHYDMIEKSRPEKSEIKHIRLEMAVNSSCDESEWFFHKYGHTVRYLPNLQYCDILVTEGLYNWGDYIVENYWGACPISNVRVVDAGTGEWVDVETYGAYQDYLDTGRGETREYIRDDGDWNEEDEGDARRRYEAMMKMSEPLPRIDLDH